MYPDSRYINPVNYDSTADWINLWTSQTARREHVNQPTNLRMLMASVDFPLPIRKTSNAISMHKSGSETNLYDLEGQPVPLLSK